MDPDADPGGTKTYRSYGSGSGSATLPVTFLDLLRRRRVRSEIVNMV